MYDLNDLEKKWIIYKKQKYKKIGSLGVAFLAVALVSFGLGYLIFGSKNTAQTANTAPVSEQNNTLKQAEINQTALPGQPMQSIPAYQYQPLQKEVVIISPEEKKEEFKSFQPTEQNQNTAQTSSQQPQQRTVQIKPNVAPKITIETKSAGPIEVLASRYSKNPDAATAISLSEIFYKQGNYQKSLKWAMNANAIDPKAEKSWIMFAKSSYKLGRKQDALNALENFSKTSSSEAVKTTISQIKNNEL